MDEQKTGGKGGSDETPEHAKNEGQQKPKSERATHQGGGGVNADHKPHGGGPVPTGRH